MSWSRSLCLAMIAGAMVLRLVPSAHAENDVSMQGERRTGPHCELRRRLQRDLDRWCRWLAGYLYQVPGTDFFTLAPTLGTGRNPYRDIAGNQFAAAAAGYWLQRAEPDEDVARPLRGLIKLALGSHVTGEIDRPDIQRWGATFSSADDWHASLFAAASGMLLGDALSAEQQISLRTILAWEADKHAEYGISAERRSLPGRWPQGSCGESNAWTCAALQAARVAWPDSDRQTVWRNAAIDFSLSAICLPEDLASARVVAGRPLKERVRGANFAPGGIQEHHGFYHPGYMAWPLAYQAFAALLDETLPESSRDPDVYLNHWQTVFDRLKQATFANGRFIYCAGSDWNNYGYGNAYLLPIAIFAAARFHDPDAARLAEQWLALVEHQQELAAGSVQGSRLATLERLRVNDFAWYEAIDGCCLAQALWVLDHVDEARIPPASSEDEYHAHNTGLYYEPNARLVWHRGRKRWASFCWRSAHGQFQALVQPIRRPHLLKFNYNSAGIIDAVGTTAAAKVRSFRIEPLGTEGFWSLGVIDREAKSSVHGRVFPLLRQYQALVALPEGPTLLVDQCLALDQLWLRRTGGLGLRLAADVFNENRVSLTVDGVARTFGQHPERDTWHDLAARSITIEKTFRIRAVAGEGSFQLLQKRRRSADRSAMLYASDPVGAEESLLAHELYFGPPAYDRPRLVAAGEWLRSMVLIATCDAQSQPEAPAAVATGGRLCFAVHLPLAKCTVAVNFADSEQATESAVGTLVVGPRSVRVVR